MLSRDLVVLSRVAGSVPVYEVIIPWGPPFGPEVAPALFALGDPAISV